MIPHHKPQHSRHTPPILCGDAGARGADGAGVCVRVGMQSSRASRQGSVSDCGRERLCVYVFVHRRLNEQQTSTSTSIPTPNYLTRGII